MKKRNDIRSVRKIKGSDASEPFLFPQEFLLTLCASA